jgi:hypothetical protein
MTDTSRPTRMEVRRAIAAEPSAIFDVVRSPDGHVAIDASGMLMSATGKPATAVGDEFVVHMDREALNDYPLGLYDVIVRIVTYEQDREIAWTIDGQLKPPIGHVYGYRLEPIPAGDDGDPVLRLVRHPPAVGGGGHLPDHPGVRPAGDARHPRPDRRPRRAPADPGRRGLTSGRERWCPDRSPSSTSTVWSPTSGTGSTT